MPLSAPDIQTQLTRRRRALSALTTPRNETDSVHIQSGTEFGYSLGPPIGFILLNQDPRPHDYSEIDFSGTGIRSAGGAIPAVAAGAIAERYLGLDYEIEFGLWWSLDRTSPQYIAFPWGHMREKVDTSPPVRCRHTESIDKMASNYIGGPVTRVIKNAPIAVSEPRFDTLEAKVGRLCSQSRHLNPLKLGTTPNTVGGIQDDISNGENVYFKVGVKRPATIGIAEPTSKYERLSGVVAGEGRHESCVVPSDALTYCIENTSRS
ncbi:chorismate synthase [Tuber brumale]|nr:chorismate synthase [Tuber brumale]